MYQKEFSEAKVLLDDIINNGGFSLADNFYDNYDMTHENNRESIFEIQASTTSTTSFLSINFRCCFSSERSGKLRWMGILSAITMPVRSISGDHPTVYRYLILKVVNHWQMIWD